MRAKRPNHKPGGDDRGRALLAEILATPSDVAPRLVYADWLEQQGHPFADVIRRQLDGQDASALIEAHREAWLGPVASWFQEPLFERGMLRRLYGKTGAYAQKATQQALLAPASTFGIAETMVRGPSKQLGAAATLACTSRLWWWDCQLEDDALAALVASPHLARLAAVTLEKLRATDRGLHALAGSRLPLAHLAIQAPVHLGKFTADGVLALLEHLPLTSLELTGLHTVALNEVVASPHVRKLTSLSVETRHVRAISSSPHLHALASLRVRSTNHVSDADVEPLLANPAFTALAAVHLSLPDATARRPSAELRARLAQRFGAGFTYDAPA